ncbi:MAG: InlB B-repeat-containing protein [Acidimicrobiales bacterium]
MSYKLKSDTNVLSRIKLLALSMVASIFVITACEVIAPTRISGTILVSNAVTFNENDYLNDPVYTSQIASTNIALTLFNALDVKFANPGFTFDYWTTNPDGSGTQYSDGAFYNFALGNMDLYAQWIPNHVTFYENASSNDSVTSLQSASTATSLTLFSNLNPSFSKPGYVFSGWSTSASGAGTTYNDGSTYDFTLGSMSLYAQWTPATFSINYAADGGTAGATSATFTTGAGSLTLPSASEPGYNFDGWYTAPQGGALVGLSGSSFTPSSSTTLYAQWSANAYSINYAADGGTAGATSATFTTGAGSLSLPSASEPGYNFDGWYTAPQGGALVGLSGSSFTPTSSTTLYARWSAATSQVSYVGNGGTVPTSSASYTTGAAPLTLPTPTQAGFTFDGWFTAPQGGSLVGTGGSSYEPTSATTLFAQWTAIPAFNVTFSANGGVGSVGAVSALSGATLSLPSPASISRPGYEFIGWNTVADGSGTAFSPSSTFALAGPMTLYAQWHQLPAATVTFAMNGASGSVAPISSYDGAIETLPTPPALARPGYVFMGWNTRANGKGSTFAGGVMMTLGMSLKLYAQWSGHAPARLVSPIGPFTSARVGITGSLVAQVDRLASLVIRQRRGVVTLYGYPATAANAQAGLSEGRARVASVALALRRALARAHHGGVRVVVVDEGLATGDSNRVSVVVH